MVPRGPRILLHGLLVRPAIRRLTIDGEDDVTCADARELGRGASEGGYDLDDPGAVTDARTDAFVGRSEIERARRQITLCQVLRVGIVERRDRSANGGVPEFGFVDDLAVDEIALEDVEDLVEDGRPNGDLGDLRVAARGQAGCGLGGTAHLVVGQIAHAVAEAEHEKKGRHCQENERCSAREPGGAGSLGCSFA